MAYIQVGVIIFAGGMLITGGGDGGTCSITTGGVGATGSGMVVNMQYVQSE